MFESFDLLQDRDNVRRSLLKLESKFTGLRAHVALTGKLRDNNVLMIPDLARFNMLVTSRYLLNRVRMQPPLVGECCGSDKRRSNVVLAIRRFIDKQRQFPVAGSIRVRPDSQASA